MSELSDPQTLWERRHSLQLVDVREKWEYARGAIPGAVHIPLGELMSGVPELDAARPIVVVCQNGEKSELAALMLQARGYEAANLAGGMQGWEAQVLPLAIPEAAGLEISQAN